MNRPGCVDGALKTLLGRMLPTSEQTLFLRACLHEDEGALETWYRGLGEIRSVGTPVGRALSGPLVDFLPLLARSFERAGAHRDDASLMTHLRLARVTEQLRWKEYRAACAEMLGVLNSAGIPFIVLKGASLGELVYPQPTLRHTGDVDVLLRERDLARGTAAFLRLGWRQLNEGVFPSPIHLPPVVHPNGLPIELHRRLLIPYYRLPDDKLWARSRPARIAGVAARILSPADDLLHVISHAMQGGGLPILRWVPDAWFILSRNAHLDWATFVSTAVTARLGLPVHVALEYLAREIDAPIPPGVREAIGIAAVRTGLRGRAAARLGARPWATGSARQIWTAGGSIWRRLSLLWRRMFPPPLEFALLFDLSLGTVLFQYVRRLTGYARRRPERAIPPAVGLQASTRARSRRSPPP